MTPAEVEAAIGDAQEFLRYLLPGSLRRPQDLIIEHSIRVHEQPDAHDLEHQHAAQGLRALREVKNKRGGQTKGVRNGIIVRALLRVERNFGLEMTRSAATETERDSCCSIVAAACQRLGNDLAERGVEEIWRNSDERKRRRV